MAEFGQMLSQLRGIEVPVIDRTGIAGTYDIVLKGAPAAARDGDTTTLLRIIEALRAPRTGREAGTD